MTKTIEFRLFLKNKEGGSLDSETINLPLATYQKDGLLSFGEKSRINDIPDDISSAISTHDESETAHSNIRTLIANLQDEVDGLVAGGGGGDIASAIATHDADANAHSSLLAGKVSKVTTAGLAAYTKNGATQSTMNIDNASPTASTLVQRDTSGRIKASAGVANNDVVNVEQLNNALGDIDAH